MSNVKHVCRWVVSLIVVAAACGGETKSIEFSASVKVVDEQGDPIAGATVDMGSQQLVTDSGGGVDLPTLDSPVVLTISGDRLITEVVPIGRSDRDRTVTVRMLSDGGGTRWVMHTGGDVMFGRRYVEPTGEDVDALIPRGREADGARQVVAELKRAFSAADFRTINLETVVSELTDSALYPGKRFILNSHPGTLAGLIDLGVDVVTLGNNHAYDYLEQGVTETLAALDDAGLVHTGATDGSKPAAEPAIFTIKGVRVAVFSWTTVNGSFVINPYPDADDPIPDECDEKCQFQYEERPWGYSSAKCEIPVELRRIGVAWREFSACEGALTSAEVAQAWSSLYSIYPELQDWVARRGHGGAANWDTVQARRDIAAVREDPELDVDLIVAQLHAGFQFQGSPSSFVRQISRNAIDSGADIVIAHHPHVLQGAEWYKDKLIAYSLGNFIFDQDFLVTFPSVFLRTVWEGTELIEARFVLTDLVDYRPMLVTDRAAERTALLLWEQSSLGAYADRDVNSDVRIYANAPLDGNTQLAHMRMRHHDAWIAKAPPERETLSRTVPPEQATPIDYAGLVDARVGGADVLIGRDLFGWGHFEDTLADGVMQNGAHWAKVYDNHRELHINTDAASGFGYVSMKSQSTFNGDVFIRPVARIPMLEHRLYRPDQGGLAAPLDGEATYMIRMKARLRGAGTPYFRLEFNQFDDTNPTEDPSTTPVSQTEIPIEVPGDGAWHTLEIPIPRGAFNSGGIRANVVLIYLRFSPPEDGDTQFAFDDLSYIEWRPASGMPEHMGAYDFLYNPGSDDLSITMDGMPLRD